MKKLCFGVFGRVLLQCTSRVVTEKEFVGIMAQTIDATSRYNEAPSQVSRLLKCLANFSDGQEQRKSDIEQSNRLGNVISNAREAMIEDVKRKMQANVVPLLDEDKKPVAILALLDIIAEDKRLDGENKGSFERYFGTTKTTLLKQSVFVLADFLTRALLYTVAVVDNRDGLDCIDSIDEEYVEGFTARRDKIKLINPIRIPAYGTPAAEIRDMFNKAVFEYHIVEYICSDPSLGLAKYLVENAIKFIPIMRRVVISGSIEAQKEKAYQIVFNFTQIFAEYHDYLGERLHQRTDIFVLEHREIEEDLLFGDLVFDYKQKLDCLYRELNDGNTMFVL